MLLPKRWVVERRFAWLRRFRRLGRDYEPSAAPCSNSISSFSPVLCLPCPPQVHNRLQGEASQQGLSDAIRPWSKAGWGPDFFVGLPLPLPHAAEIVNAGAWAPTQRNGLLVG